jgi:hypothetical protein
MKKELIFVMFLALFSMQCCKEIDKKKEGYNVSSEFEINNEDDYLKVQGVILKKNRYLKRELLNSPEKGDIYYIYNLNLAEPQIGIEKNSELMYSEDDLVTIMVHKKDSTKSFIGYRGIVDQDLLYQYLTRIDSNYYKIKSQVPFNK